VSVVNNVDLYGGEDGTFPDVVVTRKNVGSYDLFYEPI